MHIHEINSFRIILSGNFANIESKYGANYDVDHVKLQVKNYFVIYWMSTITCSSLYLHCMSPSVICLIAGDSSTRCSQTIPFNKYRFCFSISKQKKLKITEILLTEN